MRLIRAIALAIVITLGISHAPGHLDPEDLKYFRNLEPETSKLLNVDHLFEDLWVESRPQPNHGLAGRRIILSAGHGRTWNQRDNWWGWQRDVVHFGEVEDLITPRIVNRWLAPYFENAGANLVVPRERDEQLHEIILDDTDETTVVSGEWDSFTLILNQHNDPWLDHALVAPTTEEEGDTSVTWHATIPEEDAYGLRIWYPAVENATTRANLIVHTVEGDVGVVINQQDNQGRWLWIDHFVFPAGNVPIATMTTESTDLGRVVVADAIRLGGGMGDYEEGGGVSGLPRWQEFAKSWAKFYGAPPFVWDRFVIASDFTVRSGYTSWVPATMFYEVHSNASGTPTAQQTGTQMVWSRAPDQERLDLLEQGHLDMIQMLRDHWLPTWRNDSFNDPSISGGIMQGLVEVAYHDRLDPDLLALVDPDFRRLASRAMYQKIATAITLGDVTFLPEPPEAPAVQNLGEGRIRISWAPPAWGPEVTSYRVYQSSGGLGFDLGEDVGDVLSIERDGLDPGEVRFFQIRAINAGGRSFPTETIGVRVGEGDPLLVVNGFTRLDRLVQEPDNPRHFVRDYIRSFGAADGSLPIDSSSRDAIASGRVSLGNTQAVAWILGKQSTEDRTFPEIIQPHVTEYIENGGRLFLSGTDIARDLVTSGNTADRRFARATLFVGTSGQRTTQRSVSGVEGTPFEDLEFTVSGQGERPYRVDEADVLTVDISGRVVLQWAGTSLGAAIAFDGGPGKVLAMATPFEAILGEENRVELAGAVLEFLRDPVVPDTTPPSILNPRVAAIGPDSATIRWETDKPSRAVLHWGTTTELGNTMAVTEEEALGHRADLVGLPNETTHYYQIVVTDFFDNETTSEIESFVTLPPDTDPPIVTGLVAVAISDRDAIVRYKTNKPATSGARWGLNSTNLSSQVSTDGEYVTEHLVHVTPLLSNRDYHVAAMTRDIAGNETVTDPIVIRTMPNISPLIVDNVDPGYQDTGWTVGAFTTQMIGDDYAFASTSPGGTMLAEWTHPVPLAGRWQAHANYVSGANRSSAAPYRVYSRLGTELVLINQQAGGGAWQILGSPGLYGDQDDLYVTLSNDTDTGGIVLADAIRWSFVSLSTDLVESPEGGDGVWMLY